MFFILSTFLLSLVVFIQLTVVLRPGIYEPDLEKRIAYARDPAFSDQLCREDVKKAKRDVKNGNVVFTQRFGFGTMPYRFEKELRELCKSYDITFDLELIYDFFTSGNTQGCYADYMDGVLNERFGPGFKENLLKKADSLFIKNAVLNDAPVDSWYCDEGPYLTNTAHEKDDYNFLLVVEHIPIEKDTVTDRWPHMDLGFIVEKDSSIDNLHVSYYADYTKGNARYEQALLHRASEYLKTIHPIWIPGKIEGHSVRTAHNVRLFFRPE